MLSQKYLVIKFLYEMQAAKTDSLVFYFGSEESRMLFILNNLS